MATLTKVKLVQSTPVEMYTTGLHQTFLENLTLSEKWNGQMAPRFHLCVKEKTGKTVLAYVDGKPVGWTLIFKTFKKAKNDTIYFYVDKNFRRQGIGSQLMEESRKIASDTVIVAPWNPASDSFFGKLDNVLYDTYVTWTDEEE